MPRSKKINIRMFGNFDIQVSKKSVLPKTIHRQGFNRLLIFFLMNRGRVFSIDSLIEKVWPDKDYRDRNSIIRTQVFRLKQHLALLMPKLDFLLEFTHGGYCFTVRQQDITFDIDEFAALYEKIIAWDDNPVDDTANKVAVDDTDNKVAGCDTVNKVAVDDTDNKVTGCDTVNKVALCREALALYQNGFLGDERLGTGWLASRRLEYRHMWLRIVGTLIQDLQERREFGELIALCRDILKTDDSEESVHEAYIGALDSAGYHSDAQRHREARAANPPTGGNRRAKKAAVQISAPEPIPMRPRRDTARGVETDRIVGDFGLAETARGASATGDMILRRIDGQMAETVMSAAERDLFLSQCSILSLCAERSSYTPYLCVIEMQGGDEGDIGYGAEHGITRLVDVVKDVFRKSDVLCEWSDRQLLVLMACEGVFEADLFNRRISQAVMRESLAEADEPPVWNAGQSGRGRHFPLDIRVMPIGRKEAS